MSRADSTTPQTSSLTLLMAGLIVWMVRFLAVYLIAEAICSRGWEATTIAGIGILPAFIVGSAVVAILLDVWIALIAYRRLQFADTDFSSRFMASVALAVAAISVLAIVWEALPVFILPACR